VTFGLLLNLVGVMGADATNGMVWEYLSNYRSGAVTWPNSELDKLISLAITYHRDFVAPTLKRRKPSELEAKALRELDDRLADVRRYPLDAFDQSDPDSLQNIVYAIGNEGGFENLRDWFKALYETLLGSSQGPRMGSFIALYGIDNTRKLIAEALQA